MSILWPPASSRRRPRTAESDGEYDRRDRSVPRRSLICAAVSVAALLCSPMGSANPTAATLSPAEVQAIAEEGFIYGLPLVMNYSVMNAFAVNRDS